MASYQQRCLNKKLKYQEPDYFNLSVETTFELLVKGAINYSWDGKLSKLLVLSRYFSGLTWGLSEQQQSIVLYLLLLIM